MFTDYTIIITNQNTKKEILFEHNHILWQHKIYTLAEFKKLYYFNYDNETVFYITQKYKVNPEIAKIYLENLYKVKDKKYKSKKLNFLVSLKKELIENRLISINNIFLESLKGQKICVYNLPKNKELELMINDLNKLCEVTYKTTSKNNFKHKIYKLKSLEDEVSFVAEQICELIKNGVLYKDIYLTNLNEDYQKMINRIFPMFNLPFTLQEKTSIFETHIGNLFYQNYQEDLAKTIEYLKDIITNEQEEKILNQIIAIINNYTFINDKMLVKDMIKYDLKHTYVNKNLKEGIKEVTFKDSDFHDEDHVFLLSFNQSIIPKTYKDEDYLNDLELEEISFDTTLEKNIIEKEIIEEKISSINNLYITCKEACDGEDYLISSLNDDLDYQVVKVEDVLSKCSNNYNQIYLTSLLDEYYKYGTESNNLFNLYHHYNKIPYKKYSHNYKKISKENLLKHLNNNITLSYSSLDKYYRCPFSYYIGNILHLNIFEETFEQHIGTLFHRILERMGNEDVLTIWDEEINNLDYKFNAKELFFLRKLKEELLFITDFIKECENYTNLHDELHEELITKTLENNPNVKFTGIIDKIKYKHDGNNIIAAIIDYKTGTSNMDLSTIYYGIGMQLPVYLYLIKNSDKFPNLKISGFYLQKILHNEITKDNIHSYEDLKRKNLLLQGYSNSSITILNEFDKTFNESKLIKGLKTKKDGTFYNYSKVLTSKEMDCIASIVEEKINNGAKEILEGNFEIAPKKIDKINYGCTMCKFRDICFYEESDIVELEKLDIKEILKEGE